MKDENSVPTAQKMTDVSLSIFRSKFKKTRIQMIDYICRMDASAALSRTACVAMVEGLQGRIGLRD